MPDLLDFRDRIELMLMDTGNAIWDVSTIDIALDDAMTEYNLATQLHMETVITLPGDGREIALSGLTGLQAVLDVWWPYDSDAEAETWPPNRVRGWRLWWDDAQPVLILEIKDSSQPQLDDEMRIWYSKLHTIQDLNSADSTTLPQHHYRIVELGAAGYCAMSRTVDLVETAGTDLYQVSILGTWGQRKLREFRAMLKGIQREKARRGMSWGVGWALDKWDEGRDQVQTTYG
jgi:hypothetical protein